ncbi:hypothetical protein T439DRAFT_303886 [Meredithblackwellia eburnea MCA 4105]
MAKGEVGAGVEAEAEAVGRRGGEGEGELQVTQVEQLVNEDQDEDGDDVDIFGESLLTLFDHHQPIHGEPNQLFTYTPPSSTGATPLVVRIPPQAKTELFAHYVWDAGTRLADRLSLKEINVRGKVVLELGAGAGIPGLVCAREGAKTVVLSDYNDPHLIKNLKRNIELALSPVLQDCTHAVGFSWGEDPSELLSLTPSAGGFDLILLADTLWFATGHALLLSALSALLSHSIEARIEVVAGFHSGRETVRSFLRKAEDAGFERVGDEWEEVSFNGSRRKWGWDVEAGLDEEQDIGERNRSVVQGSLGRRSATPSLPAR